MFHADVKSDAIRRRDILRALAVTASAAPSTGLSAEGWVDVSPGADLSGWTEYPWFEEQPELPSGQWRLDTGRNVLICSGEGPHTRLLTDAEYEDFVWRLEWRFLPRPGGGRYNSGVFVRMQPDRPGQWVLHQVETGAVPGRVGWFRGGALINGKLTVLDTRLFVDGQWSRVDPGFPRAWRKYAAAPATETELRSAYDAGIHGQVHPPGEWNAYEITCRGSSLSVKTNGVETSRAYGCLIRRGRLGLEAEGWAIEFRNMALRRLSEAD